MVKEQLHLGILIPFAIPKVQCRMIRKGETRNEIDHFSRFGSAEEKIFATGKSTAGKRFFRHSADEATSGMSSPGEDPWARHLAPR
jgi:hypothetical protein